jgi:hypothetical protein
VRSRALLFERVRAVLKTGHCTLLKIFSLEHRSVCESNVRESDMNNVEVGNRATEATGYELSPYLVTNISSSADHLVQLGYPANLSGARPGDDTLKLAGHPQLLAGTVGALTR